MFSDLKVHWSFLHLELFIINTRRHYNHLKLSNCVGGNLSDYKDLPWHTINIQQQLQMVRGSISLEAFSVHEDSKKQDLTENPQFQ